MAISADDFTARDLGLDAGEPIALAHEKGDPGGLLANVVELQHERVGETAVGTSCLSEKAKHVAPCHSPSAVACRARLAPVQLSAVADVLGSTLLTVGLLSMKVGQLEAPATAPANPCLARLLRFRRPGFWLDRRSGRHRLNATCPYARRAERHAEVACDRAHRPTFGSESASFPLLQCLPHRHANTCSQSDRTY
jgi:hypothetical protein